MKLQPLSYVKKRAFQKEISTLENGGRIKKANLDYRLKHPVLLPKEGHITHAIIRDNHEKVAHAGWGMTINEICNHGYWIINCTSAVKSVKTKCVECRRKLNGKICQQKMGNLPADRISEELPFTCCGVDMFGPFLVKDSQKTQEIWGDVSMFIQQGSTHRSNK